MFSIFFLKKKKKAGKATHNRLRYKNLFFIALRHVAESVD